MNLVIQDYQGIQYCSLKMYDIVNFYAKERYFYFSVVSRDVTYTENIGIDNVTLAVIPIHRNFRYSRILRHILIIISRIILVYY